MQSVTKLLQVAKENNHVSARIANDANEGHHSKFNPVSQ